MRRMNTVAYCAAIVLSLGLNHKAAYAEADKAAPPPATVVLEPVEEVPVVEDCASCEAGTPVKFRVWRRYCPEVVCSTPCKQPYLVHTCYTCEPSVCHGWSKMSAKSLFRRPLAWFKKADCAACYSE